MKLYEVPRGTWVRSTEEEYAGHEFKFERLDGAYSYCVDREDKVRHFAAWLEVEIIEEKKG